MTVTFNSSKYSELLSQYQPKLIRTEADNERALEIVEALMNCPDLSPEENELYDLLIVLVEKFEQEFYQPSPHIDPHTMLQFLLEQQGLSPADLVYTLGPEPMVTELLAGDRKFTIAQIKALGSLFQVDPSVFI